MNTEFNTASPIYTQLAERICRKIIRQELLPGEKLLGVREMAVQTHVNPKTVQRAYTELEQMDIVKVQRGIGRFITTSTEKLTAIRQTIEMQEYDKFIKIMSEMGFTPDEIVSGLAQHLSRKEDK